MCAYWMGYQVKEERQIKEKKRVEEDVQAYWGATRLSRGWTCAHTGWATRLRKRVAEKLKRDVHVSVLGGL